MKCSEEVARRGEILGDQSVEVVVGVQPSVFSVGMLGKSGKSLCWQLLLVWDAVLEFG